MPFTDEEFQEWHRAKRQREWKPAPLVRSPPIATCIHCDQPFGLSEGVITEEVTICDICNGD